MGIGAWKIKNWKIKIKNGKRSIEKETIKKGNKKWKTANRKQNNKN